MRDPREIKEAAEKLREGENSGERLRTDERNRIRRRYVLIGLAVLVAALVYLLYTAFVTKNFGWTYSVSLIAALLFFWVMSDIVAPRKAHDFDDRSPQQMDAYKKMAICELVGYAGLAWFGLSTGGGSQSLYGAIVFLLATMLKRKYRDQYMGVTRDENGRIVDAGEDGTAGSSAGAPEEKTPTPAEPMTAANRLERLNRLAQETPEDDDGEAAEDPGVSAAENTAAKSGEEAEASASAENGGAEIDAASEENSAGKAAADRRGSEDR